MWVAIEGVVGAGKTTTTTLAGQLMGLETALERSNQHPFLDAYYRAPARYVLETELAFMLIQVHHLRDLDCDQLISDFSPAKNLVFARLEASKEDLQFLERADTYLWDALPRPDLVVFLDVPLDVCLRRVVDRGRGYEQNLEVADLRRIRKGYFEALESLGTSVVPMKLSGLETPDEVATMVAQAAALRAT